MSKQFFESVSIVLVVAVMACASRAAYAQIYISSFYYSTAPGMFSDHTDVGLHATVHGLSVDSTLTFSDNGLVFQKVTVHASSPVDLYVKNIYQGHHHFVVTCAAGGSKSLDANIGKAILPVGLTSIYLGAWANQFADPPTPPPPPTCSGMPAPAPDAPTIENNAECLEMTVNGTYHLGTHLHYVDWGPDWASPYGPASGYQQMVDDAATTKRRIPIMSWHCGDYDANVAKGGDDALLGEIAIGLIHFAKTYPGFPIMIRWFWEMNDLNNTTEDTCLQSKSPPALADSVETQADNYVAAYQHIIAYIAEQFKDSETPSPIVWVFNPAYYPANCNNGTSSCITPDGRTFTNDDPNDPLAKAFYPGADYIDWIGFDGYFINGMTPLPGFITSPTPVVNPGFYPVYANTDTSLNAAPPLFPNLGYDKPLLIGETGVPLSDSPSDTDAQANILKSIMSELPASFPQIKSVNYFDAIGPRDNWILDGSPTGGGGLAAFDAMATNSYFGCNLASCP